MTSRVKMLFLNYEPSNCDCSKAIEKVCLTLTEFKFTHIQAIYKEQDYHDWFNHQNADRIYKNFKRD